MAIYQREVENPEHVVRELYGTGGDTDPMRPLPANCASAPSRIRRTGRIAPALFCGRLTVAKLRRSDPEFLAAKGID
jgi:hypothetical protein